MITLGSFLHREDFRDLLSRWLLGEFESSDAARIKELVNFNSVTVRLARDRLSTQLLRAAFGAELSPVPLRIKGELKDLMTEMPASRFERAPERANECIALYRRRPELFYRETPVEAIAYLGPGDSYLRASSRIKRIRRICEKCSRRMIGLFTCKTSVLAGSGKDWSAERSQREKVVLSRVRELGELGADTPLVVDDILGFKLLGGESIVDRVLDWSRASPDIELVKHRELSGDFNATKLVLKWRVARRDLASVPLRADAVRVLRSRGMDGNLGTRLREFILDGEENVTFEVIVQSFEEALESEIGRCMHEERVIRQRHVDGPYEGVARTIAVLTQYLFYFALSRQTSLEGIPLRPGTRYMPDRLEQVLASLTDFPAGELGLVP